MSLVWFCERDMIDRQEGSGFPSFADAVDMAGMEAVRIGLDELAPALAAVYPDDVVGGWGPLGFLRRIREIFPARCAAVFDQAEARDYRLYATHLGHLMLNGAHETMPFAQAVAHRRIEEAEGVFIKPATEAKTFTGTVIDRTNRADRMASLKHVRDDLSCIVAPAQKGIESEYRFVIADGAVVTGSQYQRGRRQGRPARRHAVRGDTRPYRRHHGMAGGTALCLRRRRHGQRRRLRGRAQPVLLVRTLCVRHGGDRARREERISTGRTFTGRTRPRQPRPQRAEGPTCLQGR